MAAHVKFLFDTDLDDGTRSGGRAMYAAQQRAAEIKAAREEAFQQGFAEGQKQAAEEAAQGLGRRVDEIGRQVTALLEDLDKERGRLGGEAAALALATARTLARALIDREPHAELIALFEDCIANLPNAPHLAVRVPKCDLAQLREQLEANARASGFEGRIVVLAEDDLQEGDCRIEWADGGVTRSFEELLEAVREAVARRYGATQPDGRGDGDGHARDIDEAGEAGRDGQ